MDESSTATPKGLIRVAMSKLKSVVAMLYSMVIKRNLKNRSAEGLSPTIQYAIVLFIISIVPQQNNDLLTIL